MGELVTMGCLGPAAAHEGPLTMPDSVSTPLQAALAGAQVGMRKPLQCTTGPALGPKPRRIEPTFPDLLLPLAK